MLYTKNVNVTTTDLTTILTVPSGYVGHWNMLFISNLGGSTNTATVYADKADGTDLYILKGSSVNSKDYVLFSDAVVVLQPGDIIKCQTGSAGDMEFVCTVDLIDMPQSFVNFNGI